MKSSYIHTALGLLALILPALANVERRWSQPLTAAGIQERSRGIKTHKHPKPDLVNNGTFDQLLDHKDPSKGTFKQRFWFDASHWQGQGSPVFLFNAGEDNADPYIGYLEEGTISGKYAEEFGGAVIVIEHRYWGESIPFDELTTETLQYLDLPQSIHDMTYFAKNVDLHFDNGDEANAPNSPWVLLGGSYPGALAAWTSIIDPGVFWAYHASSAVVEAIYDFYPYFDAVERAIPRNCSADIKAVIKYIDDIFAAGNKDDIQDLKDMFGLGQLEHADDFASEIANPLWDWQPDGGDVLKFCDYIETATTTSSSTSSKKKGSSSSTGVGLDTALLAYATWVNSTSGKNCRKFECSTYSDDIEWNDPTDLEGSRQWNWLLCHNPFSWWQVGPPTADGEHVVSSLLRPDHFQRQCDLMFPTMTTAAGNEKVKVGSVEGFTTEHLNMYTKGWDADFERVMFVNGEFDPWIEATVSSVHRPGGPRKSTAKSPIFTIRNGNHVPDMVLDEIPEEEEVLPKMIEIMRGWLDEWTPPKK